MALWDWLWQRLTSRGEKRQIGVAGPEETSAEEIPVEEVRARVEGMVRKAGVADLQDAYRRLDAGELDGTLLQVELEMLRFLEERSDCPRSREFVS